MSIINDIERVGRLWVGAESDLSFESSSILDTAKQDVLLAIDEYGPVAVALGSATSMAQEIMEDLSFSETVTIPPRPTPKTERPGLSRAIEQIEALDASSRNTSETENQIAQLIGASRVTSTQVQRLSSRPSKQSRFIVEEIDERYYRTGVSEVVSEGSGDPLEDYQVSTQSGTLGLEGFDVVSIDPDGTINLTSESGETRQIRMSAQNAESAPGEAIQVDVDAIIDDVEFERWACAILSLGDRIVASLSDLTSVLADMVDLREMIARISARLPIVSVNIPLASRASFLTSELERRISSLVMDSPLGNVTGVLGSSLIFDIPNVAQGRPVTSCDLNRQTYCAIKRSSEAIRINLASALLEYTIPIERVASDIVVDALTDIDLSIDAADALLEPIRTTLNKIPLDACAVVQGIVSGTPKSFQDAITLGGQLFDALSFIAAAFAAAGVFRLPQIDTALDVLSAAGYDGAADALRRGDLANFLGSSLQTATHAGRMAELLREAASGAGDQSVKIELENLANVAQSRAESIVAPQRIRDAIGARTRARRSERAEEVTKRGSTLARQT